MPLSDTATRAALRQESGEAWIALLAITHANLSVPGDTIRVASEGVAVDDNGHEYVDSNGERFYAYPFEFELPSDQEGETPKAKLKIDNVGKVRVDAPGGGYVEVNILHELRRLDSPPALTALIVLASSPDTVEMEIAELALVHATGDAATIEGELRYEDTLNQAFPREAYTPRNFPGLFP